MNKYRPGTVGDEMEQFTQDIKASKQISRNAVHRIVLLSSGIVGFSVSLFSIPTLQQSLNLSLVRFSWYSFLVVIVFGSLALLMEGRIRYAITWKGHQKSIYLDSVNDYSRKEKWLAFVIIIWTLIYPANLVFNRTSRNPKDKETHFEVNGLVVHWLARLGHRIVFIENLVFIFFIIGLFLLIRSFVSL